MGNRCCKGKRVKREKLSLLLVGLDNAGKTVTAKGLAGETVRSPIPTVGFSVINLKYLKNDVRIFDLGGGPGIRGIWHRYFVDSHGIIFVIDSCDVSRFPEVQDTLEELLSHPKVTGKPLLVLANKQDQESALDEIDIIECLQIETLANRYKCPTLVQSCSASARNINKIDEGIRVGYEWIMNHIIKNFKELDVRVQMDVVEQQLEEREEMLAKIKRIRAEREASMNARDPNAIETYSEYVSKLNGDAVRETRVIEIDSEDDDNDSVISETSLTFPAIYHLQSSSLERERPRSAVQLVKHQLQMTNELKRSQSAKSRRNKTAPAHVLHGREFVPASSKERSVNVVVKPHRQLHSADDKIFTVSGRMGPGGDYTSPMVSNVFTVFDKFQVQHSLKKERDPEGARQNGMCIVDVE